MRRVHPVSSRPANYYFNNALTFMHNEIMLKRDTLIYS